MRTELYNVITVAAMLASAGFVACTNNIDRPAEVSVNTISEQLAADSSLPCATMCRCTQ